MAVSGSPVVVRMTEGPHVEALPDATRVALTEQTARDKADELRRELLERQPVANDATSRDFVDLHLALWSACGAWNIGELKEHLIGY